MVVPEMMRVSSPPWLIILVVMLASHTSIPQDADQQYVELFAGMGCVSLGLMNHGLKGSSHDIVQSSYMDLASTSGFLLAMNEVRRLAVGGILWLGLCCNSFSKMSRGTHGRDHLFPLGNTGYSFVKLGNLLASRCCLLIYVAVSRGCRFVLEQPDGTSFPFHPRWQELIQYIQVWSCSFWMGAIGGSTAKRHRLYFNSRWILSEVERVAGYLSRADMRTLPGDPLVHKYVDQNGIRRHAGIPGKLKNSQHYSMEFGHLIGKLVAGSMDEKLPEPKRHVHLDLSRGDAEIFRDHYMLAGHGAARAGLGDMWEDAELPTALMYLAKNRDMRPRGRWEEILRTLDVRHL